MNILVIAPHADDEILGVGGTIAKFIDKGANVYVCITSRGFSPYFSEEIVEHVLEEAKECHKFLNIVQTFFLDFPASMLEHSNRSDMIGKLYKVIEEVKPEIVFIPHFGDMQKDHKIIAESAMVALRPKYNHKVQLIYAYETVSETEWNIPHSTNSFIPNVYIDISEYLDIKLDAMRKYHSQLSDFPGLRSIETIKSLAKYRGSIVNVNAAESFALVRQIL